MLPVGLPTSSELAPAEIMDGLLGPLLPDLMETSVSSWTFCGVTVGDGGNSVCSA